MKSRMPGSVQRVNKELWVILSLFAIALLLNQVIASQRMVLSLYVLPTIASSYFYGRRHGTLYGVPQLSDAGTYSNIRITATDGNIVANMQAFTLEVPAASSRR